MFVGTIEKGKRLDGYLKKHLVLPRLIKVRHDELAEELHRRNGIKHRSPLYQPDVTRYALGEIDREWSREELHRRCEVCRRKDE